MVHDAVRDIDDLEDQPRTRASLSATTDLMVLISSVMRFLPSASAIRQSAGSDRSVRPSATVEGDFLGQRPLLAARLLLGELVVTV